MILHYLTIREMGDYIGTSFRTLEGWKGAGYLPPHIALTSRIHKWKKSDVDDWMELTKRGLWDDWIPLRGELGPLAAWDEMVKRLARVEIHD